MADSQTVSPDFLFSATIVALEPPGATTSTSPSMSGDSAYAHFPGLPPKSFRRSLRHCSLPSAVFKQTRSPLEPRAYSTSPSTVGVLRVPGYWGPWLGPTLPIVVFQTSLPSVAERAWTYSL